MDALLIVIGLIVGIVVLIPIFMLSAFFVMMIIRALTDLLVFIIGISFGIYISNLGNVAMGVIVIIASLYAGAKWFGFLEDKFWDKHWKWD